MGNGVNEACKISSKNNLIKSLKKILIISPHFPPSNLAAVHRSRLFAQHLPSFGWTPIILAVNEKYYEEKLDWNMIKLLSPDLRIEKVNAFAITKPRLIGDIGLRGFFQIFKRTLQLIRTEKIDFLYIPIPSFYVSLIGRIAYWKTGVKYGIDYIDPWVHFFAGSEKIFTRHWWSTKISSFLEPIAIKKASLITGVSEGYYLPVIKRNPWVENQVVFAAMPYGGEKDDHEKVKELGLTPYLFEKKVNKVQLIYAGAMLPKAYTVLDTIFKKMQANESLFSNVEIHFIGTGKTSLDPNGFNIKPYAEKYGLWQKRIFEYPQRIPYLDVLIHLEVCDGAFILGSTEPHYTPSKVYQSVLSGKPIFAVLHQASSACQVISSSNTGVVLKFDGENDLDKIEQEFIHEFSNYLEFINTFSVSNIIYDEFEKFSAKAVTKILSDALNQVFEK